VKVIPVIFNCVKLFLLLSTLLDFRNFQNFFIKFLTEPGNKVLDIFAGSNTTGAAAEAAKRYWIAFEQNPLYLASSAFRFVDKNQSLDDTSLLFKKTHDVARTSTHFSTSTTKFRYRRCRFYR